MEKSFNFTETAISLIEPTEKRQMFMDDREKNLCLFVYPSGKKTFYLRKKIKGRLVDIKIGDFPIVKVTYARNEAVKLQRDLLENINPNEEKKKFSKESTLKQLFETFMEKHARLETKEKTHQEYERLYGYLKSFDNTKISRITKEDVENLKKRLQQGNGTYTANAVVTLLKIMYNKAAQKWNYDGPNPTIGISKFKVKSRDRFLQSDELKRFFISLNQEKNEKIKNYVYLSLYTGQRRSNVLAMAWDELDLDAGTWRIPETKNGESLTVPLVGPALDLLKDMKKAAISDKWVFPSNQEKVGHLQEPKKAWKGILERAGISNLRLHDLRRTMGSYQAIAGVSLHIIGKSLGHKSQQSTQVYARMNLDPVRDAMERAVTLMTKK